MPGCNQINKKRPSLNKLVRRKRQSFKHATFTTSSEVILYQNSNFRQEDAVLVGKVSVGKDENGKLKCIRSGRMGKNNTIVKSMSLSSKKVLSFYLSH